MILILHQKSEKSPFLLYFRCLKRAFIKMQGRTLLESNARYIITNSMITPAIAKRNRINIRRGLTIVNYRRRQFISIV